MKSWLLWSVLALISWGFWGLFPKFATNYVSPRSALFWEILGGGIASTCWIVTQRGWPEVEPRGILFGAMAGMLALIGAWCYTQACAYGNISRVVTVTALYPVITVLLAALVLKEPLGPRQVLGLLFAIVAIILAAT